MIQGVTLALLATLLGVYFFGYVPGQREYFANHNLRQLALTADQMRATIEGLPKAVRLAARSLETREPFDHDSPVNWIKGAVKLIPTLSLTEEPQVSQRNLTDFTHFTNWIQIKPKAAQPGGWLQVEYIGAVTSVTSVATSGYQVTLRAKCDFDQLIASDEFEGILLADENGSVLFQRVPSGTRVFSLNELQDDKGSSIQSNFPHRVSGRMRVLLSGNTYQMLIQPMQVSLPSGEGTNPEMAHWVVCGLVRSAHFEAKALEIRHIYVVGGIFFLLFFAIHLPFLKIGFAAGRARLRPFDAFGLLLGTVCAAALLTFIFLYFAVCRHLDRQMEADVCALGLTIKGNFTKEISQLHHQLAQFHNLATTLPPPDRSPTESDVFRTSLLTLNPPLLDDNHLFFQTVAWIDFEGVQTRKWTVRKQATPLFDVSDRAYFRDARVQRPSVWNSTDHSFWLESVYASYSADNSAVLSVWTNTGIISIEGPLLSVMRPVLPAGFGFCIVGDDGRVLFHSNPARNLRENLFEECGRNPRLISSIQCRSTNSLDLSYLGRRHKACLMPLNEMPWMLMTFADEQVVSGAIYEIVLVALILYWFYIALLTLLTLVAYVFTKAGSGTRENRPSPADLSKFLWPATEKRFAYWRVVAVNLGLAILLVKFQISHEYPWGAAIWTFVGPFLGALLTLVLLHPHPDSPAAKWVRPFTRWFAARWRNGPSRIVRFFERCPIALPYLAAASSACLLLGVVPAYGVFKTAYDQRLELHAKQAQFSFAEALNVRAARIEQEYRSALIPAVHDSFLNERLSLAGLDVYAPTNFHFSRSGPSIDKPDNAEDRTFSWLFQCIGRMRGETPFATHGVFQAGAGDGSWHWDEGGERRLTLQWNKYRGNQMLQVSGGRMELPENLHFASLGIMFVLLAVPVYFVARWIFLLKFIPKKVHHQHQPEDENGNEDGKDKLHLGYMSGNLLVLGVLAPKQRSLYLSLKPGTAREGTDLPLVVDLASPLDEKAILDERRKIVVLDHFEYCWEDPNVNRQKLRLTERLTRDPSRTTVLFCTVDPMNFYLRGDYGDVTPGAGPAKSEHDTERHHWDDLLRRFQRYYLETEKEANYRLRWAICSRDEQLALYQVATDGFVQPAHPGLKSLLARGLLEWRPNLSLKDDHEKRFSQFVLGSIDPQTVRKCEEGAIGSSWSHLKGPFYFFLIIVALLLFLTQPDIYKVIIGLVTGFAAAPPAISRLLSYFSNDKGAQAANV